MSGIRRRYNLEKLISDGIPVMQQLPANVDVNQLKWGLRGKLESLKSMALDGQEIASIDNYPMVKEQIKRLESLLEQEISALKSEILKIYQMQAGQTSELSEAEVERQKKQEEREIELTEELQNKWQSVLEKISEFPQTLEEQLQLQQSVFVQEISGIISELAILRQDKEQCEKKQEEREAELTKELNDKWQEVLGKMDTFPKGLEEQLQLQQSAFIQEISRIISELVTLQQDKEQLEREKMAEQIRHVMDEMEFHMLEEAEWRKKQEEREIQLRSELQDKLQDVLTRIEALPQGVEKNLQLQQDLLMKEFSGIISELAVLQQDKEQRERLEMAEEYAIKNIEEEIRHLMDEMKIHIAEAQNSQRKQEECDLQLTKVLQDKWQDILEKIDRFPQMIEEQLQLQQKIVMPGISTIISKLVDLKQNQEQWVREQTAEDNTKWNALKEVRYVMGKIETHMLEEAENSQKKQEERDLQLTKALQDKWQDILEKIDGFPQGIGEQLQLQQKIVMPEISTIISKLTDLKKNQEQWESEQTTADNTKWNALKEVRYVIDKIETHMSEEVDQQKKQEEREVGLTKEVQDISAKINAFPQEIEEQLQLQQSVFMQEASKIIAEVAALQQDRKQWESEQTAADYANCNIVQDIRHLMDEIKSHMLEESNRQRMREERESQLRLEIQNKWQDILGRIDGFPYNKEEQMQSQQSIFMSELSTLISELVVLKQDKEQREREEITTEVRHLMDKIEIHMVEEAEWQRQQHECESELRNELQDRWQEVLSRIDAFPQGIEKQLQMQQNMIMPEISTIISELAILRQDKRQQEREQIAAVVLHLMDKMETHMLEDIERQKKQEEREIELRLELQEKWQDVLGKIDSFPQGIEEHLQLQQSVFLQEFSGIISELTLLQQNEKQDEREQMAAQICHLMNEMEAHMVEEVKWQQKLEDREVQLTNELQNKWREVSGKMDAFPRGIEEQLQQSVFMQEFSKIMSEMAILQQDKKQREGEEIEGNNAGWNALKEVRHLIDEMSVHIVENIERQKKQEEREIELTRELQEKWQDMLGKITAFPQGIEEQLELQQSVFIREISRIISQLTLLQQDEKQWKGEQIAAEVRQLMDEMKAHMLEDAEQQRKQEERESGLINELQEKWQDVLEKIDAFPQGIENQLQLQQNVFMQEISAKIDTFPQSIEEHLQMQQHGFIQEVSGIISEFSVLQQKREEIAEHNQKWSAAEDIRHLIRETEEHIVEEVRRQKQQEEHESQLTRELQDKCRGVLEKIDIVPQEIEEQLQLQQSAFIREISGIISELIVSQQNKKQQESEEAAEDNAKWNLAEDMRHLLRKMEDRMVEEAEWQRRWEERESQLMRELQSNWQDVSGKIDGFPNLIEEQLQVQQNAFMQEVSEKVDKLPKALEEQLQVQQNTFMQEVSGKVDRLPKELEEQLQMQLNEFIQEVSGKVDRLPKELEEQLQMQLNEFIQEVSGKVDRLPKELEEQLQVQQNGFMQEVSEKVDRLSKELEEQLQVQQNGFVREVSEKVDRLPKELEEQLQVQQNAFMQEVSEKVDRLPKELEEQLQTQQNEFMQEVSEKVDRLPKELEEQLQMQQNGFMQEVSEKVDRLPKALEEQLQVQQNGFMQETVEKIDAFTQKIEELQSQQTIFTQRVSKQIDAFPQAIEEQLQLQYNKEQRERNELLGDNGEWNVAQEVFQVKNEMGIIRSMLEDVIGYSRKLAEIVQQNDRVGGEIAVIKVEVAALCKELQQANAQIERLHSLNVSTVCPQVIEEQLEQCTNRIDNELLSLKEEVAFIKEVNEIKPKRKKGHH